MKEYFYKWTKTVFCIGNGESRSPIDLIRLRHHTERYMVVMVYIETSNQMY